MNTNKFSVCAALAGQLNEMQYTVLYCNAMQYEFDATRVKMQSN